MNLDSPRTIILHKKIIKKKAYLTKLYNDVYKDFKKAIGKRKPIVELGSGGGFIKEVLPGVVTSDVVPGPDIDRVFSAAKIPFSNNSIGVFLMFSVLHHIKDPESAFKEIERCLKPKGKILMVEPFNSALSKTIFKKFHKEAFDSNARWEVKGNRRLTDANLALPWIIFFRDRELFKTKFPNLKIIRRVPFMPLRYLFSGGISYSWCLPLFFYDLVSVIEKLLFPLNSFLGMFVAIELEKEK